MICTWPARGPAKARTMCGIIDRKPFCVDVYNFSGLSIFVTALDSLSKSGCLCADERTHILDVEVKDFLHECGGHSDHHYVSPVLTKGPHHDHPHIPKRKYFSSKSPNMKQCKCVFDSSYLLTHCTSIRQNFLLHCITFCKWLPNKPTHLFFSISLKRRKTLPLRSFSLLTGSNDRLARINSFCNCCRYRHHYLSCVFLFDLLLRDPWMLLW